MTSDWVVLREQERVRFTRDSSTPTFPEVNTRVDEFLQTNQLNSLPSVILGIYYLVYMLFI